MICVEITVVAVLVPASFHLMAFFVVMWRIDGPLVCQSSVAAYAVAVGNYLEMFARLLSLLPMRQTFELNQPHARARHTAHLRY